MGVVKKLEDKVAICLAKKEIRHRVECTEYYNIYHCFDSRSCDFKEQYKGKNYCGYNLGEPIEKSFKDWNRKLKNG